MLISLNGDDLVKGTHINLSFAEGEAGGFAGCNGYGSEYIATGEGSLTIPVVEVTLQLCEGPEGVMEQEKSYVEAFSNAAAYRVKVDGLEIDNAASETTLIFAVKDELSMNPDALKGTQWRLLSLNGISPIEGPTATIVFHDEHRVSGDAGCRGYVAAYETSGDDMGFTWLAMTGELCAEPELMTQEGQYTSVLEWAANYVLAEGRLEILTARGETLVFEPLPENADASLEGTTWALAGFIEEKTVEEMTTPLLMVTDLLASSEITVVLENGAATGSAGCNSYGAGYSSDGASLTFGPMAVTEMACLDPEGLMAQEQRYLGLLRG